MQEEVVVLALREPGAAFSGATGLTKGLATGEVVPAAGTRPDSFPWTAGRGILPQQRGKRSRPLFLALVGYGEAGVFARLRMIRRLCVGGRPQLVRFRV